MQKEWDRVTRHPLQSWAWGEFRNSMGIPVERIGVFQGDNLTQGWQITFHSIPHTPFTIGYFPKGPVPSNDMINFLKEIGKKHNAIFIQFEPDALHTPTTSSELPHSLRPSHHPLFTRYTFVLDLTQSEEQLLKNMQSKSRYNIKVALKHGVTVQEDNSDKAFEAYLALSQETTARQGFYAHTPLYHKRMWQTLKRDGTARLFTATYQDKTLAAWIIFCWGQTIYYPYGASSTQERQVMAPNLLLWEIAKWGKKHNYTSFDLWGAMGPEPDIHDPWFGFHRFKSGYSPKHLEFVGSFDLVIQPLFYSLYTVVDKARWTYLTLAKKVT